MWAVISALAVGLLALVAMTQASSAAKRGRDLFNRRCTGCHSLDKTKVGPPLRSIFLRRSASIAQFPYSDALKQSQLTWDAATLDRWLTNPEELVPDTDMAFRLNDPQERAAIIAYLEELSVK